MSSPSPKQAHRAACRCRPPRRSRDCAYCGYTSLEGGRICGVCKEDGIDGPVIRGTERRTCAGHAVARKN